MATQKAAEQDAADNVKKWAALVLAAALLLIYLVLLFAAMGKTGDQAEQWARRLMLLGGIEAMAFAGAGWLFGKEVSRQAIDQANTRAADAKGDADKFKAEADTARGDASTAKANAVALAQSLKMLSPPLERQLRAGGAPGVAPATDLADTVLAKYGVGA